MPCLAQLQQPRIPPRAGQPKRSRGAVYGRAMWTKLFSPQCLRTGGEAICRPVTQCLCAISCNPLKSSERATNTNANNIVRSDYIYIFTQITAASTRREVTTVELELVFEVEAQIISVTV